MALTDNKYYSWVQVAALVVLIICAGVAQGRIQQSDQCLRGCREGILMCSANCGSKAFSPHSQTTLQEMATCLGACGAQILGCMNECFTMPNTPFLAGSPGEPRPSLSRYGIPTAYPPEPTPMDPRPPHHFKFSIN